MDLIKELLGKQRKTPFLLEVDKKIAAAKKSFWAYCCLVAPDFYKPGRAFLQEYCETLQALYERRLFFPDGRICRKLMINFPPRHGKSRTLVLFVQWAMGQNPEEKVLTCSYNDDVASDFSRFTRDGIGEASAMEETLHQLRVEYGSEEMIPAQEADSVKFVFQDVFQEVRLKEGNASFQKWALAGKFFSYKGAGVGGAITGRGGSITIVDDPIKDAETAYNEGALEKIYSWYINTFKSRAETGAIQIINMTRWASKDICGRLLEDEQEAAEWMQVRYEACDEEGNMLCESILSKEEYSGLKRLMAEDIFLANYHQQPVDKTGGLYADFMRYEVYDPDKVEKRIAYTDTADEGADYLCQICADIIGGYAYIRDVYYTDEPMEKTEKEAARRLDLFGVREAIIESNNGGRGFARNVEKELKALHNRKCNITWFHQGKNKRTRILVNASNVASQVIMPELWKEKWPEFYKAIRTYQRKGKNAHDDGPDALTGLIEFANGDVKGKKRMKLLSKKMLGM